MLHLTVTVNTTWIWFHERILSAVMSKLTAAFLRMYEWVSCLMSHSKRHRTFQISRDHSFQRNMEFWAEQRNLPISTELLAFHGILWNSVLGGGKGTNTAYFDGVQATVLYVYMISPWNTWLPLGIWNPNSHLRSPPGGTPASIPICLIFPETTVIGLHFCRCMYGSIFIQICAVYSKRSIFSAPESVLAVQGPSGSSKVDFGTNQKRVYDFLFVPHCDYSSILHRFWDIATYWLKIAYFC